MLHEKWIPTLEAACIGGFLFVFIFLHLLVMPRFAEVIDSMGGRAWLPTAMIIKFHELLQPPWFGVLVQVIAAGIVQALSKAWHARMPAWPWVPLRAIILASLVVLLFVAVGIGPDTFHMSEHFYMDYWDLH